MALNTFPTTNTIAWSVTKSPNLATRIQRSVSGRELRVADYVLPIYTFTLTYEVLRDRWDIRNGANRGPAYPTPIATPLDELRAIWNFYLQQSGPLTPFKYHDPSDNTTRAVAASPQVSNFAVGDGTTTVFQMASPLLAPVIPTVVASITPAGLTSIDLDTGLITFVTAPGVGVSVGADMQYDYKVRFATDGLEAENFYYQLWQMKQLKLVSVLY